MFELAMAESNIIHHKHTCPACGFPTLNKRHDHEVCVLCLWEDGTGEARPASITAPNYISLIEARVNIASVIGVFEQTHAIDDSVDNVIKSIRRFEHGLERGEAHIDRVDFATHLTKLLPTIQRSVRPDAAPDTLPRKPNE